MYGGQLASSCETKNERTDGRRDASFCPLCLSGASVHGERRYLRGGDKNPGSNNKDTKFCQLIVRKNHKNISTRCHILRVKCTKIRFLGSVRLPVRPFVRLCLRWSLTLKTEYVCVSLSLSLCVCVCVCVCA